MTQNYKILGDWGNSSGRLYLCYMQGDIPRVISTKRVTGAKDTNSHEAIFLNATNQWRSEHKVKTALICGAIGSNIGWREVSYIPLPADQTEMLSKAKTFESGNIRVTLLGGVKIEKNIIDLPDTMRGEETQAFGWIAITGITNGLLCMPGTHTKWALIKNSNIVQLNTGLSGELFEIISQNSMLTRGAELFDAPNEAFNEGVRIAFRDKPPALIQTLMSVRNKQLFGQMEARVANSYLAGLIIGDDVRESVNAFEASEVHIIGSSVTASHYERALAMNGISTHLHDDRSCTLAGLSQILKSKD